MTPKLTGGEGHVKRELKQSINIPQTGLGQGDVLGKAWSKKYLIWILKGNKQQFGKKERVSKNTGQGNSIQFHRTEGKDVFEYNLGNKTR